MTVFVVARKKKQLSGMLCATAMADILNKRGIEATAAAGEAPGAGTLGVFARLGLLPPEEQASFAGRQVALAGVRSDFADISALREAGITASLDTEYLDTLAAGQPQTIWIWPKGCAATVIKSMYDFYGMEISSGLAGALLTACLEETNLLAHAAEADKKAAASLAAAAGVADMAAFGKELLQR